MKPADQIPPNRRPVGSEHNPDLAGHAVLGSSMHPHDLTKEAQQQQKTGSEKLGYVGGRAAQSVIAEVLSTKAEHPTSDPAKER